MNRRWFFTVVTLAGLFQILFGLIKLGRYISLVPFPVISGFMSGIGYIIMQLAPLAGHTTPAGGTLAALAGLLEILLTPQTDATIVGLITLGIVCLTPARINRTLPFPLIALVLDSVLVLVLLEAASVLGENPTGLLEPRLPTFTLDALPAMVQPSLILALLGSIAGLFGATMRTVINVRTGGRTPISGSVTSSSLFLAIFANIIGTCCCAN